MSFFLIPLALLIFLIAWMLIRTLQIQKIPDDVKPAEKISVDKERVSKHLSEAIYVKTVSKTVMNDVDMKPFLQMHDWIERTYPLIAKNLTKQVINQYSLLYFWEGTDPHLQPVLLNAHMDVVPVDEETRNEWKVDPFAGEIKEGFIWGRGALDMKSIFIGILESVEGLLEEGYSPKRTIYLTFGHDEEISGFQGSLKIMEYLKSKGVRLAALLDEGGMLTVGTFTDSDTPVALIGTSEKGYLTIKLSAEGKPGHSSRPPRQTAIGIISRAVALMDDHPMKAKLDYILPTLKEIGYMLPFSTQFMVANPEIFGNILKRQLEKKMETNALIRTTHAATIVEGGIKDNVLPASSSAWINLRLLPGDSINDSMDYFREVIKDPRVKIEVASDVSAWEATDVSSTVDSAYLTLELVIRQIFNNVQVAPFVFLAATDSRHYQPICDHIYKLSPYILTADDQSGVHGINERISQEALIKLVAFYSRLIRVWGEAGF